MNEPDQLHSDPITGLPAVLNGASFTDAQRAARTALNRQRARSILAGNSLDASGEPPPPDVWAAALARRAEALELPLIPIERMGLTHDASGFLLSSRLLPMRSGAEAQPFCDARAGVVYKLFDLRRNGALGKQLAFRRAAEGEWELASTDATLADTVLKLTLLHDAGAHPTELVGLSDDFRYLIAKQPLAFAQPYSEEALTATTRSQFLADRETAITAIHGVICTGGGLRQTAAVIAARGQSWLVADLHERNIMRDFAGRPTIIDALTGPVPPAACQALPALARAVTDAAAWSRTGQRPVHDPFGGVNDADL